jgi:hypothetical protein
MRRDFYIKALAEKLGLPEASLHDLLGSTDKVMSRKGKEILEPGSGEIASMSERTILSLLFHYPELIPTVMEADVLRTFESHGLKQLAMDLEGFFRKHGNRGLSKAFESLDEDFRKRLSEIAFRFARPEGDPERMLQDCLQKIREHQAKRDKRDLLKRIREAEKGKKGDELQTLLLERQKLAEMEKTLQAVRVQEK